MSASGGGVGAHCQVVVMVGDVNDNAPSFPQPNPVLTVIEEDDRDLPLVIATVRGCGLAVAYQIIVYYLFIFVIIIENVCLS